MPVTPRGLIFVALLALAGCGGNPPAPPGVVSSPATSPTCERTCNTEYDTCMDRFAGAGASTGMSHGSLEQSSALGPNDVCPDQLKACLRRCLN